MEEVILLYIYNKMKICYKCKIEKNISFYVEDVNICQICLYLEKQNRKKINEVEKTKKICSKCKNLKEIINFNKK